ncbi:DNA-binding GntR family transcriptional regulator [Chelatococcus caeni]|uniref:DNA-binding GntR family transcriptional regulator n=1 Tax=Chelatococcus caeni TaxID=1348468 RepID=A0A840BW22_9HYPH|nr:DNA-binding GntR family transcriptional regulator [Chelatococcus caeni]
MTDDADIPRDDDTAPGGRTSLHALLTAQLRSLLLDGTLPGGSRIPEQELCRRFGVSRTPLREALKVLAAEGFVTLRPNRGAIVAPIDPAELAPIFEVKGALERLIGLTVPERATEDDIAGLEELHQALRTALAEGEHAAYTHINHAFHQKLAQATRNPVLIQNYAVLQQKIWRYRFAVNEVPHRLDASFAEHERIMVALRARTRLDLAERLEEHNRLTGEAMARALAAPPVTRRSPKVA